ncbi:MAG: epsilon-lactone hydrolase [Actinomycetota bacterium]|nr:epsilon-lactone hydrolase [Actinomycetota bacterium]
MCRVVGTVLHVAARDVPAPSSISPEAQAVLSLVPPVDMSFPAPEDTDAWRAYIASNDEMMLAGQSVRAARVAADVEEIEIAGVPVFSITPHGTATDDRRVYVEIHGGGMIMGGGASCRAMGLNAIVRTGVRTIAVDFRMPPDHPFPTSLDDCVAVYRGLLDSHAPGQIVVGGISGGGNLAAATILRARDEGLPLPAAAVLLSPEVDLTESGDSFRTNLGVDVFLTGSLMAANLLYAGGHDLSDPYVSPLFGDFSKGWPPTLLSAGTRDLFLSNAVRMHRALRAVDVPAELHILEAAPHTGFLGDTPEDLELAREVRRFVAHHLSQPDLARH